MEVAHAMSNRSCTAPSYAEQSLVWMCPNLKPSLSKPLPPYCANNFALPSLLVLLHVSLEPLILST